MKKSLLALAAFAAVGYVGAASAQSSVTIYGLLDQGVGKQLGTRNKEVFDAGGTNQSRLGFKGVEDLGGGLKANFLMEHRFTPDTGAANATFWQGSSTVGLSNQFGSVNIGRQYTALFSLIQNQIDPWGGFTVAQFRDIIMRPRINALGDGTNASGARYLGDFYAGVSHSGSDIRTPDSVRLDFSMAGFNAAVSVGERPTGTNNKPVSFAANYSAGPLFVGVGYLNPESANDKLVNVGATYNFGFAKLAFGYAKGTQTTLDVNGDKRDTRGILIGATIPVGATDIKLGYGQDKVGQVDCSDSHINKLGIGAHYNLSKRTKVYVDYAHANGTGINAGLTDALVLGPKSAYDLGIFHSF